MELVEAQLFRMLTGLFGRDRVVFRMSALAVCGGQLEVVPEVLRDGFNSPSDLSKWAAGETCLFTVVDAEDSPKLVIELATEFVDIVDPIAVEHHRILPPLLKQAGIHYLPIPRSELNDLLDPRKDYDLLMMLEEAFCGGGCEEELD
jgi:hypothetical protein